MRFKIERNDDNLFFVSFWHGTATGWVQLLDGPFGTLGMARAFVQQRRHAERVAS